jgi:hypothetical protein
LFELGLETYEKGKSVQDVLPEIEIDGKNLASVKIADREFKSDDYYFAKVSKSDWRGLLLGGYTGCCQILGNDAQNLAIHGAISKYAGFYAIFKKNKKGEKNDPACDEIVAQSYAWLTTKGNLVFDSVESMRSNENLRWLPFYEKAAEAALHKTFTFESLEDNKDFTIQKVTLGQGGKTPKDVKYLPNESYELPVDGGPTYADAQQQWVLAEAPKLEATSVMRQSH